MSVRVWTEEKLNWIIESAKTTKDRRDILKAFNERFNKNLSLRQFSLVANEYKIQLPKSSKIEYVRYNAWLKRERIWTKEKLDFLIESKNIYDDREDILNAFNKRFGTNISLTKLKSINTKFNLGLPVAKKKIEESIRKSFISSRGFYEKDIGDEILSGTATYIKKTNHRKANYGNYVLKQKYLYEKYHNVKLSKNDCVIFLNGNRKDFSKENLYRLTKGVSCLMSTNGFYKSKNEKLLVRIKVCEWKEKINELKEKKNEK